MDGGFADLRVGLGYYIHLIVSQTVSLGKIATKGLTILRWVFQLGKITSNIFSLHNYLITKY